MNELSNPLDSANPLLRHRRERQSSGLSQPVQPPSPSTPHPALLRLARILARQAAAEAFSATDPAEMAE